MSNMRFFTLNVAWLLGVLVYLGVMPSGICDEKAPSSPEVYGTESHSPNAVDASVLIRGRWYPGAMLQGKAPIGSTVQIGGREVYVDSQGRFVFGLGRDAKGEFAIIVHGASGKAVTHSYKVESRRYKTQKVEGVEKKYVSPPKEVLERISKDAARVKKARRMARKTDEFRQGFILPAEGPITGVYGSQRYFNGVPKRPHYGLDIAGPVGQGVVAPAGGVVTMVDNDMYYSGGTLIMDHGQGISSTFIHLSKILVEEGDVLRQGQKIAEIGATGRVTGPHLDWRVNWFSVRLDPQLLVTD